MSRLEKFLLLANFAIYFFIAVFSWAYVDLNLTISQNPSIFSFINFMQQLGYYHRQTATLIYLLFIVVTFVFYLINLRLFYTKKIGKKYLAVSIIINTVILIFAYPYLSSDIFNYLFDAKIIFHYHLNPYTHKALDFPQDPWIRFMRWTHRYSPYGPLWLIFSLIPFIFGFGKFILTLFTFKIFIGSFHLLNSYIIYRILQKTKPNMALVGTAIYSLNPLLLVEGVANAHNDVVLSTFLLLPIYFFIYKKTLKVFGSLVIGIFIKYIPVLTLPWDLLYLHDKNRFSINRIIVLSLLTMSIFTFFYSSFKITAPFVPLGATQTQFQPWYLFWTLPFAALIPNVWVAAATISLSFGVTLRYLPYLYYGDWSHLGTTQFMTLVTVAPIALIIFILVIIKTTKLDKNYGKEK